METDVPHLLKSPPFLEGNETGGFMAGQRAWGLPWSRWMNSGRRWMVQRPKDCQGCASKASLDFAPQEEPLCSVHLVPQWLVPLIRESQIVVRDFRAAKCFWSPDGLSVMSCTSYPLLPRAAAGLGTTAGQEESESALQRCSEWRGGDGAPWERVGLQH